MTRLAWAVASLSRTLTTVTKRCWRSSRGTSSSGPSNSQRILVPGITQPIAASILAVVRSFCNHRRWEVKPGNLLSPLWCGRSCRLHDEYFDIRELLRLLTEGSGRGHRSSSRSPWALPRPCDLSRYGKGSNPSSYPKQRLRRHEYHPEAGSCVAKYGRVHLQPSFSEGLRRRVAPLPAR